MLPAAMWEGHTESWGATNIGFCVVFRLISTVIDMLGLLCASDDDDNKFMSIRMFN